MSSSITERSSKQAVKTLRAQKNTDARLLKRLMKSLAGGNLKRTNLACSGKSFQNKLKGPRRVLETFSKGSGTLCEPANRGKQGKDARRGSGAECILTRFC